MRRFQKRPIVRAAVWFMLAAALAACGGRKESEIGTPWEPLVVVVSPAQAQAGAEGSLRSIARELSSRAGLSVAVRTAASPLDAIEQFGRRRADVGILRLEEFLLAREAYGVIAPLQILHGEGQASYEGVILVRAADPAKDLRALNGRRFAFVDPYSVSGFLLPALRLIQAGVQVDAAFADSHDRAITALVGGEAGAAATYSDLATGRRGVRILARTGIIPNEPIVFRRGLLAGKREAVAAAFQSLAGTEEGRRLLPAVGYITGLRPIPGTEYDAVQDILRAGGASAYDMVPGGAKFRRLKGLPASGPFVP